MPLARGPFRGTCRGGPFDGTYMEHDRPKYLVAKRPPISLQYDPDKDVQRTIKYGYGTYRHVAGQWIWRDDE